MTALVKELWDVAWVQWESRNEVLHHTPMSAGLSLNKVNFG